LVARGGMAAKSKIPYQSTTFSLLIEPCGGPLSYLLDGSIRAGKSSSGAAV